MVNTVLGDPRVMDFHLKGYRKFVGEVRVLAAAASLG